MKKEKTKKGFPTGLFLFLLLLQLILSGIFSGGYFYVSTRNGIDVNTAFTRDTAAPLAEALAKLASLSNKMGDYSELKSHFRKSIQENVIDEAFFILGDGTLIAHSNEKIEKELRGNITNDAFAYNIEMILRPFNEKSQEVHFLDYNIIGKKIPFRKSEIRYIKEYLYDGIDSNGWLVTKAVFARRNGGETPVGAVSFIISKDRIHRVIFTGVERSFFLIRILAALSLVGAILISILVYIRYRGLSASIPGKSGLHETASSIRRDREDFQDSFPIDAEGDDALVSARDEDFPWRQASTGQRGARLEVLSREDPVDVRKPVRDAIPVKKRKVQG